MSHHRDRTLHSPTRRRPRALGPRILAAPLLAAALGACDGSPSEPGTAGITPVSGHDVADSVQAVLPQPLVVEVRGLDGGLAKGVDAVFTVEPTPNGRWLPLVLLAADGHSAGQLVVATDGRGRASARIVFGVTAGVARVTVAVPSLGLARTVGYTVKPGAPVRLSIAPRDTGLYVGTSLTARGVLLDRWLNPIEATVGYSTPSPGISVQGATVQGLALGPATVYGSSGPWTDSLRVAVVPRGSLLGFSFSFVGDSVGYVAMGLDGSGWKRVVTVGVQPNEGINRNAGWPRWAPDGARFVYESSVSDTATRIFVTGMDGNPHRLTQDGYGASSEASPAFSRDGAWVYYTGATEAYQETLWRARADGSQPPQRLLASTFAYLRGASPSADGTQVAYLARQFNWENDHVLYVLNVATGAVRALGGIGTVVEGPRWSPRGDWIAYAADGELRLVRPDGTGSHVVPGVSGISGWTQDGTYLLTTKNERGGLVNPLTGEFYPLGAYIHQVGHADLR